jgi:signal transduction histidine kinase
VCCSTFGEPEGLRDPQHTAVEIVVVDTGCGIQSDKLEHIFREFEQVDSTEQKPTGGTGVGKNL